MSKKLRKLERYSRLDRLPALKSVSASAFQKNPVAVIGVGNVGGQVAHHLALMGFPLLLVDDGLVVEVNLGTQGFNSQDVGRPKVEARADWLQGLNPDCQISALHGDISILGAGHFSESKVLFSCLDSWYHRIALHEISRELGLPLVDGGMDGSGERLLGRVTVTDPRQKESACLLCSWDENTFYQIRKQGQPSGESCPKISLGAAEIDTTPTFMPSSLGGIVAGIQVIQGLKLLFNPDDLSPSGEEILADFSVNQFWVFKLVRNPNCLFPHESMQLEPLGKEVSQLTVKALFTLAEKKLGAGVSLSLHRRTIAGQLACSKGHVQKDVYRVIETMSAGDGETVCACGLPLEPVAREMFRFFDPKKAVPFANKTWSQLGLLPRDVVTAFNQIKALRFIFS